MTIVDRNKLTLHEEILLLTLRDEKGTAEWGAGFYHYALGGAILAELLLVSCITIDDTKKHIISIVPGASVGDPVLAEALQLIQSSKRQKGLEAWVTKMASIKKLKHKVAEELCRKGILREEEARILGIFKSRRYPELDPEPERNLISRLEQAIFSEATEVHARTAIVISLAYRSEILKIPFRAKDLRKEKKRIEMIISTDLIGKATGDVVQAVQAATMIATMT